MNQEIILDYLIIFVLCIILLEKTLLHVYSKIKNRHFLVQCQYRDNQFNIRFCEVQITGFIGRFPQRKTIVGEVMKHQKKLDENYVTFQNKEV